MQLILTIAYCKTPKRATATVRLKGGKGGGAGTKSGLNCLFLRSQAFSLGDFS